MVQTLYFYTESSGIQWSACVLALKSALSWSYKSGLHMPCVHFLSLSPAFAIRMRILGLTSSGAAVWGNKEISHVGGVENPYYCDLS